MPEIPLISDAGDPLIGQYVRLGFLCPPELPNISHLRFLDFDVLEVVGRGGIGVVLKVRGKDDDRLLAVKALAPEHRDNTELRSLFTHAGERQRRLEHPGILRVLDVAEHAGIPYIVMPFVDGGNLSQHIRSKFPLDRSVVLAIARRVAEALQYSHRHGYIHQDIKPQNILLGAGTAFITDYDLATSLAKDDTLDLRKSLCAGTLPYLPPGVACGVPEDLSRDMYSLGAVMYEMLTGSPPYEGTPEEVLVSIAAGRKPSASVREAGERGRVAFAVNLNRGGERWERRGEVRTRIGSSDSVRGWTSGGAGRGGGGVFRQGYGPGRSSWPGNTGWDGFHGGCGWTTMA